MWIGTLGSSIGRRRSFLGRIRCQRFHARYDTRKNFNLVDVANERGVEGDLFLQDIGQGLGFKPGAFDGAISVSVLQWLCNADKSDHVPKKRLSRFFSTLYTSLARGARAVFQFYPENPDQVEMIVSSAMKSGFTGGLVVDYPNSTRAKKYFLCLFAGASERVALPQGLTDESAHEIQFARERYKLVPNSNL